MVQQRLVQLEWTALTEHLVSYQLGQGVGL